MTDDQIWCLKRAKVCRLNGHMRLARMFEESGADPVAAKRQRFVASLASGAVKKIKSEAKE